VSNLNTPISTIGYGQERKDAAEIKQGKGGPGGRKEFFASPLRSEKKREKRKRGETVRGPVPPDVVSLTKLT